MNNNTNGTEFKVCSVDGCGRKVKAKSLCDKHYKRAWRKEKEVKYCKVKECNNKEFARGFCSKHYKLYVRKTKCKVHGCNSIVEAKGYCKKHYVRTKTHGDYKKTLINVDHNNKCSVNGCNGEYHAKNLCAIHYRAKQMEQPKYKKYYKVQTQKRLARKKRVPINDFSREQWESCLNYFDNRCAYCGRNNEETLHQEHVIPISRGGSNTKTNVIPSCGSCNSSKWNKTIFEWYPSHEFFCEIRYEKIIKYLGYKTKNDKVQLQFF